MRKAPFPNRQSAYIFHEGCGNRIETRMVARQLPPRTASIARDASCLPPSRLPLAPRNCSLTRFTYHNAHCSLPRSTTHIRLLGHTHTSTLLYPSWTIQVWLQCLRNAHMMEMSNLSPRHQPELSRHKHRHRCLSYPAFRHHRQCVQRSPAQLLHIAFPLQA